MCSNFTKWKCYEKLERYIVFGQIWNSKLSQNKYFSYTPFSNYFSFKLKIVTPVKIFITSPSTELALSNGFSTT